MSLDTFPLEMIAHPPKSNSRLKAPLGAVFFRASLIARALATSKKTVQRMAARGKWPMRLVGNRCDFDPPADVAVDCAILRAKVIKPGEPDGSLGPEFSRELVLRREFGRIEDSCSVIRSLLEARP